MGRLVVWLRKVQIWLSAFVHRSNLNQLGELYGTDKFTVHGYTTFYAEHFQTFRNKKITLIEIGIGGYENPSAGGESLKMWKSYFPKGRIIGIDIFDKSGLEDNRIKTFKGSQVDEEFLLSVLGSVGEPQVIIDDGSHRCEHVIKSFHLLFPKLSSGGVYVVEDVQTSYLDEYGG